MTLFPEWQEQHKNDAPQLPERIRSMYAKFGHGPDDAVCKNCAHLLALKYANKYLKCSKNKMTHGAATDWRAGWSACGLYELAQNRRELHIKY